LAVGQGLQNFPPLHNASGDEPHWITGFCDRSLVVVPEILPSSVGKGRFTKVVSNMIYFTPYIKGVIVGLVLSDGYLGIVKGGKNARLE